MPILYGWKIVSHCKGHERRSLTGLAPHQYRVYQKDRWTVNALGSGPLTVFANLECLLKYRAPAEHLEIWRCQFLPSRTTIPFIWHFYETMHPRPTAGFKYHEDASNAPRRYLIQNDARIILYNEEGQPCGVVDALRTRNCPWGTVCARAVKLTHQLSRDEAWRIYRELKRDWADAEQMRGLGWVGCLND
jgi:hypothetical protein